MKKFKCITAMLLCGALLLALALPAFGAALEVKDGTDRYAYTELFNKSVNRIKWDRPFGLLTYTNGVVKNGITVGDALSGDEIDSAISRWLVPVLEGMFNNSSNLSQSFVKAIFNGKVNPETKIVLTRGTDCNDLIPLYGTSDVSRLDSDKKDYSLFLDMESVDRLRGIAVVFPETALDDVEGASIADVFSLPDGTIDPVLVGTREQAGSKLLIEAKLQNLRFCNATAVAQFDDDGILSYYGSFVDYKFDFSFYDAMSIVAAFMGMDLYDAAIKTINTVYANIGKESIDPEQVMKERSLHVTYRCTVEVSNISWQNRDFGDVDGNGEITAADARAALRHSVALELLTNAADLVYTDVNFDGEITAADARLILRMGVGLDDPIHQVPVDKTIRITMDDPAEPDDPSGSGDPDQKTGWFSDIKIDTTPADLVQSLFDIINFVRDSEQKIKDAANGVDQVANQ